MDNKILKQLKKSSNELKSIFSIGKSGITDTFIETIKNYLDANSIVKIKSNTATSRDELKKEAEIISKKTGSIIIDIKGFTFTIYSNDDKS